MAGERQKSILVIAGFDPSGGAGILADVKAASAFGCYAAVAITSLTLQNTQGVFGAYNQSAEAVTGQLEPLFDDFDFSAIKTGMLPTLEVIRAVAETISARSIPHVVVDPVVRSTSGFDLIDDEALRELVRSLFPLASVVTPNAAEVERITGIRIKDLETMEEAGRALLKLGPRAALVKGGDVQSSTATDLLVDFEGATPFISERVPSRNTHGTGCTLASALACLLARGKSLREAIPVAKQYIVEAIRAAPGLGKGHGPLNHFPPGFDIE